MANFLIKFLLIIQIFVMLGCSSIDPCHELEILREQSPDDAVDFVVMEKDCGATTSISILIFIVPKGSSTDEFKPIFMADHVDGLTVNWKKAREMTIEYRNARIFSYTNFWQFRYVQNFKYIVSVREYRYQ